MKIGRHWAIPVVVFAAVLLLLLAPLGFGSSAFARALENASHAPLFAAVAIGAVLWLRSYAPTNPIKTYVIALIFAVTLGSLGELAQLLTATRDAEWVDVGNDFLGAVAGLSILALYHTPSRLSGRARVTTYLVAFTTLTIVVMPVTRLSYVYWQRWNQLPALATWDSPAGHYFVTATGSLINVVPIAPASNVKTPLALYVNPLREGRWVGVSIEEPWPRWSGYSRLIMAVRNPNDQQLELFLRVNDRQHNNEFDDRFNRRLVVAPHEDATFAIALSDIATAARSRQIDLSQIALVILFQDAERSAYPFYLRSVQLQR